MIIIITMIFVIDLVLKIKKKEKKDTVEVKPVKLP